MNLPPATIDRARRLARYILDGDAYSADAIIDARRLLISLPHSASGKAAAAHEDRWPEIRETVRARVLTERQGRCEWWCANRAEDPHHILGGIGRRRAFESPETVAAICRDCHRGWEKNDLDTMSRALAWAEAHRFTTAMKAIRRRLDKVEEARRARKDGR